MPRIALNFLVLLLSLLPLAAADITPLRVLLVTGGCCHDFEAQKKILSEGISARANVIFDIVHEGTTREYEMSIYHKADWYKNYDVILHNECFGFATNNAFVENIAAAHKAGVPGVMLHCSTHSYRGASTDEWRKTLGMSSYSHENKHDLDVETINPTHPVMIGFPAKWHDKSDELYKNEKLWPDLIPLAKAYGVDTKKDHVCIWLNTYGKGKMFVTTLGHENATMASTEYLDLVTRGLLWTCGKLDDKGQPVAGYGPVKK